MLADRRARPKKRTVIMSSQVTEYRKRCTALISPSTFQLNCRNHEACHIAQKNMQYHARHDRLSPRGKARAQIRREDAENGCLVHVYHEDQRRSLSIGCSWSSHMLRYRVAYPVSLVECTDDTTSQYTMVIEYALTRPRNRVVGPVTRRFLRPIETASSNDDIPEAARGQSDELIPENLPNRS